MIIEKSNLQSTNFIIDINKKLEKNLIVDLFNKIEKKQKEPFTKIYVTVPIELTKIILMAVSKKDFKIKNMYADKTVFILEL